MSDANRLPFLRIAPAGVQLIRNICVPMTRDDIGVLAAVTSSAIGGVAGGATRFVIHATDPVTLGVLRFGTDFLILLATALILKSRWPKGRDLIAVALLGILFFFAFSVLFNLAYSYTTAARGALTLSTMPLTTMLVGAALGIERIRPLRRAAKAHESADKASNGLGTIQRPFFF